MSDQDYKKDPRYGKSKKPLVGHSVKRWPFMHKGRRTVTCFISEESYRKLEDMRDELNKMNTYSEGDKIIYDDCFSISSLAEVAVLEYIDMWDKGFSCRWCGKETI